MAASISWWSLPAPTKRLHRNQSYEDWQRVMDANVRGPWLMAKAVGTYWIKTRHQRQSPVDVVDARPPRQLLRLYRLLQLKGATDALTRVLATEWAKYGTTVNAIAPTIFRSKLTEWMWKDDDVGNATRTRTLSRIPLGGSAKRRTSSAWRSICSRRRRISAPARSCMSMAASPPVSQTRPKQCGNGCGTPWSERNPALTKSAPRTITARCG